MSLMIPKAVYDLLPPWMHRHHPLLLHLPPCQKETSVVSIPVIGVVDPTIETASVNAVAIDVTGITSARVAADPEALGTVSVADRVLMTTLMADAA